jgi:hypothetical protein
MYMLGVRDQISILVRVDSVRTVPNEFHGNPELQVEATLRLSPNADKDVQVILWAAVEDATHLTASQEFVARDVTIEGHCAEDHANPYARPRVGLTAIWFGDRKGKGCTSLIRREASSLPS